MTLAFNDQLAKTLPPHVDGAKCIECKEVPRRSIRGACGALSRAYISEGIQFSASHDNGVQTMLPPGQTFNEVFKVVFKMTNDKECRAAFRRTDLPANKPCSCGVPMTLCSDMDTIIRTHRLQPTAEQLEHLRVQGEKTGLPQWSPDWEEEE